MDESLVAKFVALLLETIGMAACGAAVGSLASIFLGFSASKLNYSIIFRRISWVAINILRGVPAIIHAVILVKIIGQGPLTGIFALGLYSAGMLSKQIKDHLDSREISEVFFEPVSTGFGRAQTYFARVLPAIHFQFLEAVFHRFEINIRNASILGILGAGGVGWLFGDAFTYFQYDHLMTYTALLATFLIFVEFVSIRLRSSFEKESQANYFLRSTVGRGVFHALLILLSGSTIMSAVTSERLRSNINFESAKGFLLPNFASVGDTILLQTLNSAVLAIVATALGVLLTVPAALYAAKISSFTSKVSLLIRFALTIIRAVPDLIFVLIFVSFFGLNDLPVVFALIIGTFGVLGRFISTTVESTKPAISDFGATSNMTKSVFLGSVVFQEHSISIVKHSLHMTDINLRIAVSLGVVGLGGIGSLLTKSLSVYDFGVASAIVLCIVLLVNSFEFVAVKITRRLERSIFR